MSGWADAPRALWRVATGAETRLAIGSIESPQRLLEVDDTWDDVVRGGPGRLHTVLESPTKPMPSGAIVQAPVSGQDVWAAGVTYARSRDARMEESGDPDHYDRVYEADRPELFPKAAGDRVRGPGEAIGIRADATWNVPEAELAVVVDPTGTILGYTVGNDVSSRDIEGANPLYLPQAKIYTGSCAMGPCLVPLDHAPPLRELTIHLSIMRGGAPLYADEVGLDRLHRDPTDLVRWLTKAMEFPRGVVLLTGTALVPPSDVSLTAGDQVTIEIPGVGTLTNRVEIVGRTQ